MILDKQSKRDLHIFPEEGQKSLLEHIDFTITSPGKQYLKQVVSKTPASWEECIAQQQTIQFMVQHTACWPSTPECIDQEKGPMREHRALLAQWPERVQGLAAEGNGHAA